MQRKNSRNRLLKIIEVGLTLTQNKQASFIIAYQNELCRKIY